MAKKKDPEPAAENPAAPAADKMTQREAVEKALEAGKDMPAEGVPYVKTEFGITLNNAAFSTIKTKIKKSSEAPAKKPGSPAASANGAVAHKPAPTAVAATTNPADLARQIKALVGQYGAEAVADMAKVFADR